ncbi:MAG: ParB/RepB/Spo0J family partition protein [Acidaminococcaceae bacterium]|nr:ParB/RepB/Spo0J family partition protein [Acidaminococcaceae bacterium]
MTVDDGFSVLEVGRTEMGTKHSSKAIEVVRVPVVKVIPNPYQPRKTFDEEGLQDLAASIAQYGVLQPLLVAPMEDGSGNYLLIAGERRLRASKMAALGEIPVIISDYTQQQIAEIALIENLQREDLHYLEEAEGYEMLMNEFHLTQDSMAARVGKKQSTIANKLRLLRLSQAVREALRKNGLTERHARVLLKLPTEAEQLQIVEAIVKNNLSVRQTEEYVKKYLEAGAGEVTPKKKRLVIVNDVRIYLNSIKQIVSTIKDVGIPVSMEQDVEDGDVLVTLRIRNTKKPKEPRLF